MNDNNLHEEVQDQSKEIIKESETAQWLNNISLFLVIIATISCILCFAIKSFIIAVSIIITTLFMVCVFKALAEIIILLEKLNNK